MLDEKMWPIPSTERPINALVGAGSLWLVYNIITIFVYDVDVCKMIGWFFINACNDLKTLNHVMTLITSAHYLQQYSFHNFFFQTIDF